MSMSCAPQKRWQPAQPTERQYVKASPTAGASRDHAAARRVKGPPRTRAQPPPRSSAGRPRAAARRSEPAARRDAKARWSIRSAARALPSRVHHGPSSDMAHVRPRVVGYALHSAAASQRRRSRHSRKSPPPPPRPRPSAPRSARNLRGRAFSRGRRGECRCLRRSGATEERREEVASASRLPRSANLRYERVRPTPQTPRPPTRASARALSFVHVAHRRPRTRRRPRAGRRPPALARRVAVRREHLSRSAPVRSGWRERHRVARHLARRRRAGGAHEMPPAMRHRTGDGVRRGVAAHAAARGLAAPGACGDSLAEA